MFSPCKFDQTKRSERLSKNTWPYQRKIKIHLKTLTSPKNIAEFETFCSNIPTFSRSIPKEDGKIHIFDKFSCGNYLRSIFNNNSFEKTTSFSRISFFHSFRGCLTPWLPYAYLYSLSIHIHGRDLRRRVNPHFWKILIRGDLFCWHEEFFFKFNKLPLEEPALLLCFIHEVNFECNRHFTVAIHCFLYATFMGWEVFQRSSRY